MVYRFAIDEHAYKLTIKKIAILTFKLQMQQERIKQRNNKP